MHVNEQVFKKNTKNQRFYLIILFLIFIPTFFYLIGHTMTLSNALDGIKNVTEITPGQNIEGDALYDYIMYKGAKRDFGISIFYIVLALGILSYLVYSIFIKEVKLVVSKKSIQLYDFRQDNPSKKISWSDIRSIEHGFMYTEGSRVKLHRVKITHRKIYNEKEIWRHTMINIRKFDQHKDVLNLIEKIADEKDINITQIKG